MLDRKKEKALQNVTIDSNAADGKPSMLIVSIQMKLMTRRREQNVLHM